MTRENIIIKGMLISPGVAIGEARVFTDPLFAIVRRSLQASNVDSEIKRLKKAVENTVSELETMKERASRTIGVPAANIFEAQIMIASDEELLTSVREKIKSEQVNAEFAYQELVASTLLRLERSDDTYLRQMIHDIKAVSERIISQLLGVDDGDSDSFNRPTILVGRIFTPFQVINFAKKNVVAFLTEEAGPTSHMALIVRSLGIPAVQGEFIGVREMEPGASVIVDGRAGEVIINPDQATRRRYRRIRARKGQHPFAILHKAQEIKPVTLDDHRIDLAANLEIPGPIDEHLARLGVGVGLYRTEFLYFQNRAFPDEEFQYRAYKEIAAKLHPQEVTLRTFDLGADKYVSHLGQITEENPALGWRGIRVSLELEDVFRDQIRAMLRASELGNVRILLPMIADAADVFAAADMIDKCKRELARQRLSYDHNVKVGIMIEVPAAALMADYLAEFVDFFSIGTNDLIQYTLAADRSNQDVSRYYVGHHPAVLTLIQKTVFAAHENNLPVTICGELAGMITMVPLFVGMGIDQLSMNPVRIPGVADWITRFRYSDARRFASRVMRLTTADKVARALREAHDYVKRQKRGSWLK